MPAREAHQTSGVDVEQHVPGKRANVWADALYDLYYPLDVELVRPIFDSGRLAIHDVGAVRFGQIDSDPFMVHRRGNHIGRLGGDFYLIPVPFELPLQLYQSGREAEVAPGDLAVVGTNQSYTYEQRTRNKVLTLRIPGQMVRDRMPNIDDNTARTYAACQPAVAIFIEFANSLARHSAGLSEAQANTAAYTLIDLLALSILEPEKGATSYERSVRIAHRQRALKLIDEQLGDPALRPGSVAGQLGLSERYLQMIFAERNETLSSVIRCRRIAEAKRLLSGLGAQSRGIASIAYQVGFSDPAHFSRVFSAETGVSPKAFREGALAPVGRLA
jgi:AraC-like DNA-binding protein